MTTEGPEYTGYAGVISLPGGLEMVYRIRRKVDPIKHKLADIWLPDAPFTFTQFVSELQRYSVLDSDKKWIKYQVRGGHNTQAFYVVGCYEALLYYGCISQMSWPQVMKAFNASFKTSINSSKVLENKRKCHHESGYFISIFSAFARTPHEC
jgi:hypothetical protein